jgi:hypothetical protein
MPASLISSRLPNLPRRSRTYSRTAANADHQRQQRGHRHVGPEQPDEAALRTALPALSAPMRSTKASTRPRPVVAVSATIQAQRAERVMVARQSSRSVRSTPSANSLPPTRPISIGLGSCAVSSRQKNST